MLCFLIPSAGGKGNFFDGGLRVPGIIRWPGHIRPGLVNNQVISQMDLFPTFVEMAGGTVPHDRIIDGQDVRHLLLADSPSDDKNAAMKIRKSKSNNHEPLFFYCNDKLFAVRYGNFKIHFRSMPIKSKFEYAATCGEAGFPESYSFECLFCSSPCVRKHDPPLIYNLAADPSETYSLDANLNQDLLKEIEKAIEEHESNLVKGPALFTSLAISSIPCCNRSNPGCSCNYP